MVQAGGGVVEGDAFFHRRPEAIFLQKSLLLVKGFVEAVMEFKIFGGRYFVGSGVQGGHAGLIFFGKLSKVHPILYPHRRLSKR